MQSICSTKSFKHKSNACLRYLNLVRYEWKLVSNSYTEHAHNHASQFHLLFFSETHEISLQIRENVMISPILFKSKLQNVFGVAGYLVATSLMKWYSIGGKAKHTRWGRFLEAVCSIKTWKASYAHCSCGGSSKSFLEWNILSVFVVACITHYQECSWSIWSGYFGSKIPPQVFGRWVVRTVISVICIRGWCSLSIYTLQEKKEVNEWLTLHSHSPEVNNLSLGCLHIQAGIHCLTTP